ncbi:MAG: hypothetical protein QOJ40_1382 [Verrucomicrobiota bacterium]
MKITSVFLIAILALLLAGCRSIHGSRFYVSRVTSSSAITLPSSEADQAAVGAALDTVAAAHDLADRRTSSRFENTIRYYAGQSDHPVIVEARMLANGMVVIVVEQLHPGMGKTGEFMELSSAVRKALEQRFGYRLRVAR